MESAPLSITALYAAFLGLMLIVVSIRVVGLRVKHKVNLFDGGIEDLGQAIRVQGNFIEYVPMALILVAAAEIGGAPAWTIHAFGSVLVVARLLHAQGIYSTSGPSTGRVVGTITTWTVIGLAALHAIWRFAA